MDNFIIKQKNGTLASNPDTTASNNQTVASNPETLGAGKTKKSKMLYFRSAGNTNKHKFTIRIDTKNAEKLTQQAEELGLTPTTLLQDIVKYYLNK